MNRINPLYAGAFLLAVLLILFMKLSSLKEELREAKKSYKESEQVAQQLSSLKEIYSNKKKTKKSLERILAQGSLKSTKIQKTLSKKGMKISAKKMDAKALNSLMSKILNGPYQVTFMEIKKLNETQVSFEMEIKW
jgi:DNA repair exonuclease SbcCD ATPase subunit